MAKEAVRFVRIIRALDEAHDEFAYMREVKGYYEDFSRIHYWEGGGLIWKSCLGCGMRGASSLKHDKPTDFWEKAFQIFREEGLNVEAFLVDFHSRYEQKQEDMCSALDGEWVVDWIAEHVQ